MIREEELISAIIQSRAAYDRLAGHLEDSQFSENGRLVVRAAVAYYERDPGAALVDQNLLEAALGRIIANPKHLDACLHYVRGLPAEVSHANVTEEYRLLRRHNTGLQLAATLAAGNHTEASGLVDEYLALSAPPAHGASDKLSVLDLEEATDVTHAIRLAPSRLDRAVKGRAMRGHHILVFARPEAGKTSFCVKLGAALLRQGLRVLYTGNEEPQRDLQLRFLARLAGCSIDALYEPGAIPRAVATAGAAYDRLIAQELASGRVSELEGLVRRWKPDVLVVDQLRNLNVGSAQGNRALELDAAARAVRNMAKAHNLLAVSVTQAGDSAEGKSALQMGDVDWSNTGIQAAVDLMLGIGHNAELNAAGKRWMSVIKNKIGGTHEGFPLWVDFSTGVWKSKAPERFYGAS